jgi:hypothetical protein
LISALSATGSPQRFMELMGGSARVQSLPEQGTTFALQLQAPPQQGTQANCRIRGGARDYHVRLH